MRMCNARGLLTALGALMLATAVRAAPPVPYEGVYEARYDNLRAEASRGLSHDSASGQFRMHSQISLKVFGATVASISESSTFTWTPEQGLAPLQYDYDHKGLGGRTRGAAFDLQQNVATFHVNDRSGELPLEGPVFDPLNAYLRLQRDLEAGHTDIRFDVLDRDEIETFHFRVLDEVPLETQLGTYRTLHLERVREGDSKRHTEIWMAPELEYMLVKLIQEEPNGRTIRLDIKEASISGEPVAAPRD